MIFFTLQSFGAQQLGPNKNQSAFLHDEAGQPAVRYTDPEQITIQPFPATCRFQPKIKQSGSWSY